MLEYNLVHFETILRNVTLSALTSSRLDDFFDIVTYAVMITIYFFFGGEAGHFWGGSFYPSNTLGRTLTRIFHGLYLYRPSK